MDPTGTQSLAPSTAPAYLDPNYWDERFAKEEHYEYEWFKDYSQFRHLILDHVSVLELGCGNSQVSDAMYQEDGVTDITCIDLSAIAVERMRNRLAPKADRMFVVLNGKHQAGLEPHFRRRFFEALEFKRSTEWRTFGDGFHYFFYTLRKGNRASSLDKGPQDNIEKPTISLFHEELEGEDFIFRMNIDEDS